MEVGHKHDKERPVSFWLVNGGRGNKWFVVRGQAPVSGNSVAPTLSATIGLMALQHAIEPWYMTTHWLPIDWSNPLPICGRLPSMECTSTTDPPVLFFSEYTTCFYVVTQYRECFFLKINLFQEARLGMCPNLFVFHAGSESITRFLLFNCFSMWLWHLKR